MATGSGASGEAGISGAVGEQAGRPGPGARATSPKYLATHPAVERFGYGVSTGDLASFAEAFTDYCRGRITGTGAEQYERDGSQKFESMSFNELLLELVDELADVQNYAVMLSVRVLSLMDALEGVER